MVVPNDPCESSGPESVSGPNKKVVGARFIRILDDLLDKLHPHRADPNRSLFYDHVVTAHLIAFFNPALGGLRSIQELFDDSAVRKRFRSPRVPKSTLADAQRMFDPDLLLPVIDDLRQKIGMSCHKPRLHESVGRLLAVDGSFFTVAPRIAWAIYNKSARKDGRGTRKGQVRLHTRFDIFRGIPDSVSLTDGQASEAQQLRNNLEAGCFYVMDRGFQQYQLLADILTANSDFLVRLRKSATVRIVEKRTLSFADQASGVVEDAVVEIGWRQDQTVPLPHLRRVTIRTVDRQGRSTEIILLTNRLDLSAYDIGLIYQYRWQVELFFRWLKCVAHFEHFFSESQAGMTLQVYVAIIGTLLIALTINSKPSKYDYALMSSAILGLTSLEYVLQAAEKRRDAKQRAAERAASKTGR